MSYQDELKAHLVNYKRSKLKIDEPGIFRFRGRDVLCEHILPLGDAWSNILPPATELVRAFLAENTQVRPHKYFHHLNSSQAFAFNLFFPYFNGGTQASAALLNALGQHSSLVDWEPEAIPAPHEGTNIDATWLTTDGSRTYCEVKLSESDLGKARNDEHHLRKLREIYYPVLDGHLDPELLENPHFFKAYQFVRNVWHLVRTENSRLVFLIPRSNRAVWNALEVLIPRVAAQVRDRIARVAIEDVLSGLSANAACPDELRAYADLLAQKYLPPGRPTQQAARLYP